MWWFGLFLALPDLLVKVKSFNRQIHDKHPARKYILNEKMSSGKCTRDFNER